MKEDNINATFDVLGLKPASKRVLIALTESDTSSAADLAATLNMPKSSVYDALGELVEKSLVTEYSDDKGKTFSIPDQDQLARVHKAKIQEIESAHKTLLSFLANSTKENQVARPKIKFYSGIEGIKQAFRDMPWTEKYPEAYLMWPTTNMIDLLGEEFLYDHRKPGITLGVTVNVIEREADRSIEKSDYEWLKGGPKKLNKKRYVSKDVNWDMSYWIYGDKCLFASGGSEKIAFMVHSLEFANLMKVMWQEMWKGAKD